MSNEPLAHKLLLHSQGSHVQPLSPNPLRPCACPSTRRDGRDTSPMTNEPLAHKLLLPCPTVRRCMEEVADFVDSVRSLAL